jgi:hypothetical protein
MSMAPRYPVREGDPNVAPQLRGMKYYCEPSGTKIFQHKTFQLDHYSDDGTPMGSQHVCWKWNQETGAFDPVITKCLPSGETLPMTSPGLAWVNRQFAAVNLDMPDWIYQVMTPAMQAHWKIQNLIARHGEEAVKAMSQHFGVSGAAVCKLSRVVDILAKLSPPNACRRHPGTPFSQAIIALPKPTPFLGPRMMPGLARPA